MLTLSQRVKGAAATPMLTLPLSLSFPRLRFMSHVTAHPPGCTPTPLCPHVPLSGDYHPNPYLMDSAHALLLSRCLPLIKPPCVMIQMLRLDRGRRKGVCVRRVEALTFRFELRELVGSPGGLFNHSYREAIILYMFNLIVLSPLTRTQKEAV